MKWRRVSIVHLQQSKTNGYVISFLICYRFAICDEILPKIITLGKYIYLKIHGLSIILWIIWKYKIFAIFSELENRNVKVEKILHFEIFFGIMHSFNKNWVYVRSECTLTTIHRGYKISFYVMTKYSKIRLCTVDTISNFRCLLKCKSTFLLF